MQISIGIQLSSVYISIMSANKTYVLKIPFEVKDTYFQHHIPFTDQVRFKWKGEILFSTRKFSKRRLEKQVQQRHLTNERKHTTLVIF
jgi:hypothetical protein